MLLEMPAMMTSQPERVQLLQERLDAAYGGLFALLKQQYQHAPPHVHVKYQSDVRNYRIEIQTQIWMKPGKELPSALRRLIEAWVVAHEDELLAEWEKAQRGEPVRIVG